MADKCYAQLPALKGETWPVRVETTHQQIEAAMGVKLNRSKSYLIAHDEMFGTHILVTARATITCSGCSGDIEYGPRPGFGCDECGYTGKRIWSQWVPAQTANEFHKGDYIEPKKNEPDIKLELTFGPTKFIKTHCDKCRLPLACGFKVCTCPREGK